MNKVLDKILDIWGSILLCMVLATALGLAAWPLYKLLQLVWGGEF